LENRLCLRSVGPVDERGNVPLLDRRRSLPGLPVSHSRRVSVLMGDDVPQIFCVRHAGIESLPRLPQLGVAREGPDAMLELQDLINGHGDCEGAAVENLPCLLALSRAPAFPRRLMPEEFILGGPRPYCRASPSIQPEVVEGGRKVLRLTLLRLVVR